MKTKRNKSQQCHTLGFLGVFVCMQAAMIHMTSETGIAAIVRTAVRPLQEFIVPMDPSTQRVARRLSNRIRTRLGTDISASRLTYSVQERREFLKKTISLHFVSEGNDHPLDVTWQTNLQAHPEWVTLNASVPNHPFFLNKDKIAASLIEFSLGQIPIVQHALVSNTYKDHTIMRVELKGNPVDGFTLDVDSVAEQMVSALGNDQAELTVSLQYKLGTITYPGAEGPQTLVHLSTGKSEFSHSPYGRIKNVHKVINEKINGAIAPMGKVFSFNSTLGGPITHGNGWLDSLVIVNGHDLVPEAGGGICQGATTTMRAVVLAGLPIHERKNHSLYVIHYKQYGMGIDATVYPGKQDLTFTNDTPGDLVFLGHTVGEEAFVDLYGIPDGRMVQLEGPYFASTAPTNFLVRNRPLASSEVGWNNTVTYGSGSTRHETIVSRYEKMPHSLAKEYPVSRGIAELLGAPIAADTSAAPLASVTQTIAALRQ